MLGIVLTYFSFPEFLPYQLKSFQTYVKTPYKVIVIDDSDKGLTFCPGDYVKGRPPVQSGRPSARHQTAVNHGINVAKRAGCDCFLIFDNDMIFTTEFALPQKSWYFPQQRGTIEYGWMNLLFIKKPHFFDFVTCQKTGERTDSGGNFRGEEKIIALPHLPEGFQVLQINGATVIHFTTMSNWPGYSEVVFKKKQEVVFNYLEKWLQALV
jgi:hypothetical protein